MITVRINPSPATRAIARLAIRAKLWGLQHCAAYHESRLSQAHAGLRYARNRGTLPAYGGYFHEVANESSDWIKWAHANMVVAKSELAGLR